MDVTPYLAIRPAPRAVLDALPARADQVRFRVRKPDNSWGAVTWGELGAQIRAAAALLVDAGVAPGDRVAVFGANSVAWAAAALGVQAAGAVMVPIYPASTAAQAAYVLGHAACKAVFASAALRERAAAAGAARVFDLDDPATFAAGLALERAHPARVQARLDALDLDRPALMLYTSGTSGNPKGVPLTHRNVGQNGADWLRNNAALLGPEDRDLLWLPMSHIFGFGQMCTGNVLGWETWMTTPQDALALLPEVAPHVFMSVPAYWEKIGRAHV